MSCSDLSSVRFGSDSRNAIEEIRELQDMAKALSVFLGASAMLDIFGGNGVIGASYKIYTTDFQLLDQAMNHLIHCWYVGWKTFQQECI
ncbi:hypothetical protein ACMAZD_11750 [Vibrio sp. nBUS_14]|uniref:hypothetical protein n=1 Tax=Vibrio sp. nBUS_14 TaxID=3395321 RepID=UPI003EC084B4